MSLHIGIVMDGNGRWATDQGKTRSEGHSEAIEVAIDLAKACPDLGITTFSLYAFAIKNWQRDKAEVDHLWFLFRSLFEVRAQELIDNDCRFRLLGNRDGIPADVLKTIEAVEARSSNNKKLLIQIGLNYDGVDEIVRATKKIAEQVEAGKLTAEAVTEAEIRKQLDTKDAPDPDIIIRTGVDQNKGETDTHLWRGSGFLQFQSAQTYGIAMTARFPELTPNHLKEALRVAELDKRLFGGQRKA